jgi:DNA-binding winged helix-turn-helix (wHTH) protein/tetratricopeptide (TPR) repeat protein
VVRFAGFELDPQRAELRGQDGEAIKLRPKTFDMLTLFSANAGRVLSKQELMEAVWPNVHVGEDSLFQCIREIRTALGDDQRQMIKLVSGRGYLFEAEVSTEPAGVAVSARAAGADPLASAETAAELTKTGRFRFGLRGPTAIAAVAGLGAIVGLAVAAPIFAPGLIFKRMPPTITVMPIIGTGNDPQVDAMAAGVTDRIIDGLAKIDNIRVVLRSDAASARSAQADFVVNGELHKGEHSWTLQARMIKTATREVQPVASLSIDINDPDLQLKQSRLAAGIGHPLALRLNALIESGAAPDATNGGSPPGSAKVVIEQAMASINQTTPERFKAAQTMLEKAIADDPGNVDLEAALAALQLRGIMMVWYSPAESAAAESNAKSVLERALRAKPNFIPALEAYCRFLTATNSFLESLPACARVLSFDPWNGLALYHIGLAQINLGRFEDALANFKQADRFDTPQVSRWTWLLGAGWANALMGNNEEAVPWLQRSIAVTPGSGRTHMLLAAAYQQLGRADEAKAAMEKGLELRPGSTASNYAPPTQNASPVYLAASERIIRATIEAGLPDR